MEGLVEVMAALAEPIAKLIQSAMADDYDAEAERQALLAATRALYDLRMKKALSK